MPDLRFNALRLTNSKKVLVMFFRHVGLSFLLLATAMLAGCSRSPVVPVSGTLTFTNRDVPEVCRLTFVPKDSEGTIRPGGATMEADGTYRLAPFKGVEGLLPGTYAVRVSYFDLKKNGNPDRESDWKEYSFEGEDLVVEAGSSAITHDIEVK